MDKDLIPKLLSLMGYRNSCAWTAKNHSIQVEQKLERIEALRAEIDQHREHVDHANKEVFDINTALDQLLNEVPANRAVEVASRLFNATDDETDEASMDFRPTKVLLELQVQRGVTSA